MNVFEAVKEAVTTRQAADFGISYDAKGHDLPAKKPVKPKIRDKLWQRQAEQQCFRVYAGYLHLLEDWKERYAPNRRMSTCTRCLWRRCKNRIMWNICWTRC